MKKYFVIALSLFCFMGPLSGESPFNNKLTENDRKTLESGEILIKKINFAYNMCLNKGYSEKNDELLSDIKKFNPKYLAEVIQIKPVEGNEDLPERLEELLLAVPDYAGIPYWSERHECYFDLYSEAVIDSLEEYTNRKDLKIHLEMLPFGRVDEAVSLEYTNDGIIYSARNTNSLKYQDKMECVGPNKMEIVIHLFKDNDKWILYGIGGVNAPRVPFLTERIDTSFINRIKTFCNYIFEKL